MDELESISFPYDKYLTVKGLLCTHYGLEHGMEIYELLKRSAQENISTGKPAIIFNDDGGEFVEIELPD